MRLIQYQIVMGQQQQSKYLVPINQRIFHPKMLAPHQLVVLKDTKQNTKIIQYELGVSAKQFSKRWEDQLKQYFRNVDTSHLYLPIRYYYKCVQVCGNAGIIDISYQYYPETLFTQIMDRSEHQKKYYQQDIWKILYSICLAAYELHRWDKKLGQLSLELVFINKQINQIKIATGLTFYSDVVVDQILAPEATVQVKVPKNSNNMQEQSFCIGVIALSAALLIARPPAMTSMAVGYDKYEQLLEQLKSDKQYSYQLKQTIIRMCNINPALRITPEMIVRNLSNYSDVHKSMRLNVDIVEGSSKLLKQSDEKYQALQESIRVSFLDNEKCKRSLTEMRKDSQSSSYSKKLKKTIQKTESQYLRFKNQPEVSSYAQIISMVDRQLQSSKNTFPGKS